MELRSVKIDDIKRAEYNPRVELKEGDYEYERLKRSVEEFGYVEPIIINTTTGNVVGGHQRLTVLKDLGYEEVDCIYITVDENKEKALNVALNKIDGRWDFDKLKDLFLDLRDFDIDLSITGFSDFEIDEMNLDGLPELEIEKEEDDVTRDTQEYLSFGSVKVPLSDDELEELKARFDAYVAENGITYGFATALLEG